MPVEQDQFRDGMRRLASAVAVIATGRAPCRAGLTVSAAMSLSAEPPQLVVSINSKSSSVKAIRENGSFSVNILKSDQSNLAEIFSGRTGLYGNERFNDADWTELATGVPILTASAVSFDCRLEDAISVSTHTLMIGVIEGVRVEPTPSPLLYFNGYWAVLERLRDAPRCAPAQIN